MTPVYDVSLHMATRMNAALASEGSSAALRCFMEDLEEFELLEAVAKATGLTPLKVVNLLSSKRSPPFATVVALWKAAGLRITVEAARTGGGGA
ncbi:hypothetical protein [Brevundimonas diminuta]|jgi:DNA-binding phage protein|uniref:hypothetical protein n=1 Tax=Brevundimonas diminuta TaxID=293 RepID=UPI0030F65114